jgi:hypothetical protein
MCVSRTIIVRPAAAHRFSIASAAGNTSLSFKEDVGLIVPDGSLRVGNGVAPASSQPILRAQKKSRRFRRL